MAEKFRYCVRVTNGIPGLETAPEKDFDTYDDAWAYAMTAVDGKAGIDHIVRTACSRVFFNGTKHRCEVSVVSVNENGKPRYPIKFMPSQRAMDEYGLHPQVLHYERPAEIPYETMAFASKIGDTYKSYFVVDQYKPFEESLAKKLIDDPLVGVTAHGVYFNDGPGVRYDLQYTNELCTIFRPSSHEPVSNAVNVDTLFRTESLFVFDDGYVVPLLSEFKTHGPFAISARDAFNDVDEALSDDFDSIVELFSGSPNYRENDDGFSLIVSSREFGATWLDFERDDYDIIEYLRHGLNSVRVVDVISELD